MLNADSFAPYGVDFDRNAALIVHALDFGIDTVVDQYEKLLFEH